MVELPEGYGPGNAEHELIDYGFLQRGALGAKNKRINRKGNRYRVSFSFGPFYPEVGAKFVARMIAAKSQGIKLPYPLLVDQSGAGVPVVDGAGQAGTTLALRGLTKGYSCKEGFWLSIESADGVHYLHNVEVGGVADASGELSITINPELRAQFVDGDAVHISKPMVQGDIVGENWSWASPVHRVVPIEFTVEESE